MTAIKSDLARATLPAPHDAGWQASIHVLPEETHGQRAAFEKMYAMLYPIAAGMPEKLALDMDQYQDTIVQVAWTFYRTMDQTRLQLAAQKVIKHYAETGQYYAKNTDAPGHCHRTPGVWDNTNSDALAGKPCEWCATWNEFKSASSELGTPDAT